MFTNVWPANQTNMSIGLWNLGYRTTENNYYSILIDSLDKFVCGKLNMSFSKFVLASVHKKAQNTAVRGELARLPLGSDIIANILLYANNLEHKIKSPLLREVYIIFLQTNGVRKP